MNTTSKHPPEQSSFPYSCFKKKKPKSSADVCRSVASSFDTTKIRSSRRLIFSKKSLAKAFALQKRGHVKTKTEYKKARTVY